MHLRKVLSVTSIIVISLILGGCTSSSPYSTSTSKPVEPSSTQPVTPSPSTVPEEEGNKSQIGSIIIGAQELRINDVNNELIDTLPYTLSADMMIEKLTQVFEAEPVTEFSGEENKCWFNMSTVSWDNFDLTFSGQDATDAKIFNVSTSDENNGSTKIESPNGAEVGGDYSVIRSITPDALTLESEYNGTTYSSLIDEHVGNFPTTEEEIYALNGTGVIAENNVITNIVSPYYLMGDC